MVTGGKTMKTMLTIKALSEKTGLSSYEIRRRIHNGSCPYVRVGAKGTKILIDYEMFMQYIKEESLTAISTKNNVPQNVTDEDMGINRIRAIN